MPHFQKTVKNIFSFHKKKCIKTITKFRLRGKYNTEALSLWEKGLRDKISKICMFFTERGKFIRFNKLSGASILSIYIFAGFK